MMPPSELVRLYVERHNEGVRTRDWAPLLELFHADAELSFEGIPLGPFRGSISIGAAFRDHPPDGVLLVLDVSPEDSPALATYAWKKQPGVKAGTVRFLVDAGRIRRLVVTANSPLEGLVVREMREDDLAAADRIFRVAFGTHLGLPDPERFGGDGDYVRTRWRADPRGTLVAELGGEIVASNLVTCWGSVGFFGPLTVRPDLWDKGVARALLERTVQVFDERGVRVRGLYTFAQSAKHVRLYQRFGFWPRFLNVTLSTPVAPGERPFEALSRAADSERALAEIQGVAAAAFPGFDPTVEARSVRSQGLGDTVLVREGRDLVAFAVCHAGAGSEAGSGDAYMKVGVVRPGTLARERFVRLLESCEAFAASRGASRLRGGVHASRLELYRTLIARGWRTDMQGVSMLSPGDGGGYDRPDLWIIEDWR